MNVIIAFVIHAFIVLAGIIVAGFVIASSISKAASKINRQSDLDN